MFSRSLIFWSDIFSAGVIIRSNFVWCAIRKDLVITVPERFYRHIRLQCIYETNFFKEFFKHILSTSCSCIKKEIFSVLKEKDLSVFSKEESED